MSTIRVSLVVDGQRRDLDPAPDAALVDVLAGVRRGCTDGTCGSCAVMVDGEATRACLMFAVQCAGTEVRTGQPSPASTSASGNGLM